MSVGRLSHTLVTMSRQQFKISEHLPGNRLPTCLQVLQRYEYIRTFNCKEKITESVDKLIKEIIAIWNKAYIPFQEEKGIKRKLLTSQNSLINRYSSMKRNEKNAHCMNLSCFDVLFDIKKQSEKFRNEEDEVFYLDQKGKRVATLGTLDTVDNNKICVNQERYCREEIQGKKQNKTDRSKR